MMLQEKEGRYKTLFNLILGLMVTSLLDLTRTQEPLGIETGRLEITCVLLCKIPLWKVIWS